MCQEKKTVANDKGLESKQEEHFVIWFPSLFALKCQITVAWQPFFFALINEHRSNEEKCLKLSYNCHLNEF